MKKQISKLQYISQGNNLEEHLINLKRACLGGCDWLQLRLKGSDESAWLKTAQKAKAICAQHKAQLIINDKVDLALAVNAAGVHLGKQDMPVREARKILGSSFIIGGTANTFEDVRQLVADGVDYIGLGPFRFTKTKKKLSPILGLEGYHRIYEQMRQEQIDIPIVGIGGIVVEDIPALLETGLYGIAASGLITHASAPKQLIRQIQEFIQ